MQIVVATHNEGKLVEIRRILEEDLGPAAAVPVCPPSRMIPASSLT